MWGHILGVNECQKKSQAISTKAESTCFTKVYGTFSSNHVYTLGFLRIMRSKCRIGLKLFLRLANALCEATAKFEIFPNWFGTFFGLM
jgi:hypothetical protein